MPTSTPTQRPLKLQWPFLLLVAGACVQVKSVDIAQETAPAPTETAAPVPVFDCPPSLEWVDAGTLKDPNLTETSGITGHPLGLWAHNDSGDEARVYLIGTEGQALGQVLLSEVVATDIEDIASGSSTLYIGDIGDNLAVRESVSVYVVTLDQIQEEVEPVQWRLGYEDGRARNAETLLYDPLTESVWVVEKSETGTSGVFEALPGRGEELGLLRQRGQILFGEEGLSGDQLITGGAISPDGRWVFLRTYFGIWLWERSEQQSIGEVLSGTPTCSFEPPVDLQNEALGFGNDGSTLWTVAEGEQAPLRMARWPYGSSERSK